MSPKDNEILFAHEVGSITGDHVRLLHALSKLYSAHPLTFVYLCIKSSALCSAITVDRIYQYSSEYESREEVVTKVCEIFREELELLISDMQREESEIRELVI